ncbi:class A beta-lactamase-related serine hydrolase [Sphaerisporangium sp. TRM90804]|uniref:class A beta-lactamase-related serine hydrolase n=1 Tax=Sphaerisporangium sp. TRM90804 TaxID=3031113 RepID=UPI00244CE32B|nr:class A beta-lactamase-related serine hydrolase [Sphaerisporangium sp. TRM90804]MDH2425967.1 class A beta-lactamase-related serine hydrolase [Sphaerisporangium sp. TRM90804]
MKVESLIRELRGELDDAGLSGSFLVRDLHSGEEVGIEPELELPSASLVKIPLAVATLDRVRRGELDGATAIVVQPGRVTTPGPTGLSRFRHPARIAVEDLLYLSTAVSDSTAADALFALTPPAEVSALMHTLGLGGITVRHTIGELAETPAERLDPAEAHLAHFLAIEAGTAGRGHHIPQLDMTRANSGSARAFADLLQALWTPSAIDPGVAEGVRTLMAANVLRQRLAPDFSSDASRWSSKTGTLLNLRHEIGVVEHADGQAFAIAVLTESRVPAISQPGAEALMAHVARKLRDSLRHG